jgi:streptomycin 6-kinase
LVGHTDSTMEQARAWMPGFERCSEAGCGRSSWCDPEDGDLRRRLHTTKSWVRAGEASKIESGNAELSVLSRFSRLAGGAAPWGLHTAAVVQFSEEMRRTAEADGEGGRAWLAALPGHIATISSVWSLTIGDVLDGGKGAYVARVRTIDGMPAVLKIAPPGPDFANQVRTIVAAEGRGYVRLYAYDLDHNAALMEPLGPRLATVSPSVEHSVDVLASMLREAWLVPASAATMVATGSDKASQLIRLITDLWAELGEPCSRRLRDLAVLYAEQRASAFDAGTSVVCHGDPHAGNALAVPAARSGAESGFVFIDPDGFLCDRGYDLGVVIRGWPDVLLASDDPVAQLRAYVDRLSVATGVDDQEIWEWGFVERVSSGLYLQWTGHEGEGRAFLDSGEALLV